MTKITEESSFFAREKTRRGTEEIQTEILTALNNRLPDNSPKIRSVRYSPTSKLYTVIPEKGFLQMQLTQKSGLNLREDASREGPPTHGDFTRTLQAGMTVYHIKAQALEKALGIEGLAAELG